MAGIIQENSRILEGVELYSMTIQTSEAAKAKWGQFIMVDCGDGTTLRRPISICQANGETLRICYEVRGEGTRKMANMKAGDTVEFTGPVGNGFTPFGEGKVLLIGGGIGIYPLLALADMYGDRAVALLGFRDTGRINLIEDFQKTGCDVRIITDDGSSGKGGFVTDLLSEALAQETFAGMHVCGPMGMMGAVAKMAMAADIPCQVSLEERMGCGVGACMACVCKTVLKQEGDDPFVYKRVCADGPVFEAKEVLWK